MYPETLSAHYGKKSAYYQVSKQRINMTDRADFELVIMASILMLGKFFRLYTGGGFFYLYVFNEHGEFSKGVCV